MVVNVNSSAPQGGTISNTATATSSTPDSDPANNTDTESTAVNAQANLGVAKTDSPDPVAAGTNLTYTITVTNAGPSAAASVSLTDVIPANTTFVSAAQTSGPTFGLSPPPAGGTGTFTATAATFAAGATATFVLVVNVNANVPQGGTITNTATVASSTTDTNPSNNSDTETTSVNAQADLQVTKTDSPDPVSAGSNLTYTITLTNAGTSDAQNVSLSDAIPANTTFVSATQTAGPAFSLTTPPAGGTGVFTAMAASLPAGATAVFSLVVNVNASTTIGTTITNTATASTTTTDVNPGNNSDTETTSVGGIDLYASGADAGGGPHVRVYIGAAATERFGFYAFNPEFKGGVRVAMGDVSGDGTPDVIVGAGPGGGPHVRVIDGATGDQVPFPIGGFYAYDVDFKGGVFVASADFNNDGFADILTGAGEGGGAHIKVFNGVDGTLLASFFDSPKGSAGVRVATGDINGDGTPDIISGSGPGVRPATVRIFNGLTATPIAGPLGTFFPYDSFDGGVYVAAGDVNGDGRDDVITGAAQAARRTCEPSAGSTVPCSPVSSLMSPRSPAACASASAMSIRTVCSTSLPALVPAAVPTCGPSAARVAP